MYTLLILTLVPLLVKPHFIQLLSHSGHPYYLSYGGLANHGNGWFYVTPNVWSGLQHPVYQTVHVQGNTQNEIQPETMKEETSDENIETDGKTVTKKFEGEQPVQMEDTDKDTDTNEEEKDTDEYDVFDLDVNIFPDVDLTSKDIIFNDDEYSTFASLDTIAGDFSFNEDNALEAIDDPFVVKDSVDDIANSLSSTKEKDTRSLDSSDAARDKIANGLDLIEDKSMEAKDGLDADKDGDSLSSTEDETRDYFPVPSLDFDFGVF